MDLGRIGVVVFFAISGFIIPTSLNHRSLHPVRKFLISRLFRLYPLYWISIILGIAVAGSRHSASVYDRGQLDDDRAS